MRILIAPGYLGTIQQQGARFLAVVDRKGKKPQIGWFRAEADAAAWIRHLVRDQTPGGNPQTPRLGAS
jgi:hypothetical protein